MAGSNERGRAFELMVRGTLLAYAAKKQVPAHETERAKARDGVEGKYFAALDISTQQNFVKGAWAFTKWIDNRGWLEGATKMVLDRVPDNEAKKSGPVDIMLQLFKPSGVEMHGISLKHHHSALCHPRLPSLAQQCRFAKGSEIDKAYRESYKKIWNGFYSKVKALGKKVKGYKALDKINKNYRYDWLYEPLQRNTVKFLQEHANTPEHAAAFFHYLVGNADYHVLVNEPDYIEVKHFTGIQPPTSFTVTYPFEGKKTTFLIEFNNGWKIALRLHSADSKIEKDGAVFMTEKEDPICQNLAEVIRIDRAPKQD